MPQITKDQLLALTQERLKEAQRLKTQAENLMKRLRGEEVESDKEVERDLDSVALRFHAEHAPAPDQVTAIIRSLLDMVKGDQRPQGDTQAPR